MVVEETSPKNIATSIKNTEFLNFFFRRLRRVGPKQIEVLRQLSVEEDYPFVSPCGPELNFVRPADLPIVFHGIHTTDDGETELVFGGSLTQPFYPNKLAISKTTGRLYHELLRSAEEDGSSTGNEVYPSTPLHASDRLEYGLIRSSVAVFLSDSILAGADEESDALSGVEFQCTTLERRFPIKWLPHNAQPGPWSMPYVDGAE